MDIQEIKQLNPINLAFIGDAVYETFVRERVFLKNRNATIINLHRDCVKYVQAVSQSFIMTELEKDLTEEELSFYKRGRNSKSGHTPKNAGAVDYKRATGFEAVIGFLYLSGNTERLNEVMNASCEIIEKEDL